MRLARTLGLMGLVAAAWPGLAAAAAVNKCRAADGKLVYSEAPCAPGSRAEDMRGSLSSYSGSGQSEAYGSYLQGRAADRLERAHAQSERRMRAQAQARRSASEPAPPANADERRIRDAELNRKGGFYMYPTAPVR